MSEVKTPWKDYMGDVPMHLDYFQGSMFEAVERMAELYPNNIAFDFMGKSTTYKKMVQEIEKCAKSLKTLGVRPGDKVTIAMPNCPQAIYMFYAVNLVGGIANMIHPLSAPHEIAFYLNASHSKAILTLDQFYYKVEQILPDLHDTCRIIIAKIQDELPGMKKALFPLTKTARSVQKLPKTGYILWNDFLNAGRRSKKELPPDEGKYDDCGAILYSGGTTGTTKGIVLTNKNFNALGQQVIAANHVPSRGQDAGRHAHLPRLRSGRVHPHHADPGRPVHSGSPVHPQELRQGSGQAALQLRRGRSHPV